MRQRSGWGIGAGLAAVSMTVAAAGCGSHKSSLLLQRQARGPIAEEQEIAWQARWVLQPETLMKSDGGLELTATYASYDYLNQLFSDKRIFGEFAGLNPFFPEQVVFYVKFVNHTGKRLLFDPMEFTMVDDRGNQYASLSPDYATALAESKAPVGTVTRGVLDEATPGYFGVGLPVGKIIAKPQRRYALLAMSNLQAGSLQDGVIYDGLAAFWSPHQQAKQVRLIVPIKTDIAPDERPMKRLEYEFEFALSRQPVVVNQHQKSEKSDRTHGKK